MIDSLKACILLFSLQYSAHLQHSSANPRLDGTERHLKEIGDLGLGEAPEESQFDRFDLFSW